MTESVLTRSSHGQAGHHCLTSCPVNAVLSYGRVAWITTKAQLETRPFISVLTCHLVSLLATSS